MRIDMRARFLTYLSHIFCFFYKTVTEYLIFSLFDGYHETISYTMFLYLYINVTISALVQVFVGANLPFCPVVIPFSAAHITAL